MSNPQNEPNLQAVNLVHKASIIEEQWSPKVVAEMNDYQFKVVRIEGDFIWHFHPGTDEAFLVLEGDQRSGASASLGQLSIARQHLIQWHAVGGLFHDLAD